MKESIEDLLLELEDVASSLNDTFRHNRVTGPLQLWREDLVIRLKAAVGLLRQEYEENINEAPTLGTDS